MKLRNVFCSVMAAAMAFVACDQEADLGAPDITLSTNEIVLPSEAGDTTITVKATLDWTVNVDETVEWLAIDPMGGNASNDDQTVTLSYFANDGYDREVSVAFTIGLKTKYLTVTQKGAQGSADALIIYANDMDNGKVEKTADGYWPYPDQTDVWKNEKGSGIENVKYGSSGVTVRSVSSTTNMWFPAKGGSYFSIQDIALNSTSSLKLTFDAIHGSNNGYKKAFSTSAFKVFVSKDAQKWVELPYELEEKAEDQFDAGSAAFTVDGVENLSVTFQFLGAEDGYRLTNISLSAYEGEGATAVDFAAATEMNFTATSSGGNNNGGNNNGGSDNGGNNGGGEVTPPADAILFESFASGIGSFTTDDKVVPSGMSAVWEYSADYTCMKASGYVNETKENLAAEGWLISPEIDLAAYTTVFFTFEHAGGYFGTAANEATVWISKDGGEWINLPIEASAYPTSWEFKAAGVWDLAAYAGSKVKIAFKYLSTTTKAGTWELRNVSVTASAPKVDDGSADNVGSGDYDAEITFKDAGYTNGESVDDVAIAIDDNITATFSKASANNAPAYYDSGEAIRMYQNGATLDIQAANGKVIKEIRLTFGSKMYYLVADKGTLSDEAAVRVWTGSESSIKFTANGTDKNHRAYVAKIEVAYE